MMSRAGLQCVKKTVLGKASSVYVSNCCDRFLEMGHENRNY